MKRFLKIYLDKPELAGLALLIILLAVFQVKSNGVLLSVENVRGVMGLLPEMALVAIGVTILMICGEFDLSVGSVFALMPMSMAVILNSGVPFAAAVLLGLAICAVIGFINGYVTLQFSIPSFITTLGMLFIARSLTIVISGGFPPLLPSDLPTWLFTDYIWQGALFRMSFVWFVGIAVLAAALLSLTNFGNWIRATGGFNEAAASMGIPVKRVKIACFMLCSVLA
ncbi:MAG: ABC transporter permease, partial [Proteobacteria bacterium]|nr:ABC transporter permease [Pseudomonadota bacterium]